MNTTKETIRTSRAEGRAAALEMLTRVSWEAARDYLNANAPTGAEITSRSYGYWSGFLDVLEEEMP